MSGLVETKNTPCGVLTLEFQFDIRMRSELFHESLKPVGLCTKCSEFNVEFLVKANKAINMTHDI